MKYKLLKDDIIKVGTATLYRIQALKDFGEVRKGDLGGYIQSEKNLSHNGLCWVADEAKVFENAIVSENALVFENAKICGDVEVFGYAEIFGSAKVSGFVQVFGYSQVFNYAHVFGYAKGMGGKNDKYNR